VLTKSLLNCIWSFKSAAALAALIASSEVSPYCAETL